MNGLGQTWGGALVLPFGPRTPRIDPSVFLAESAAVIGDVEIGARSSLWYNVVVRGDVNHIRIGEGTNIQDGTVVHVDRRRFPTLIGRDVLIGHLCMVHGCTLEDGCFVGMNSAVMDGCVIETGGMLAAGSLLTPGKRIPAGELWSGRPARFMRHLTEEEAAELPAAARHYADLADTYRRERFERAQAAIQATMQP